MPLQGYSVTVALGTVALTFRQLTDLRFPLLGILLVAPYPGQPSSVLKYCIISPDGFYGGWIDARSSKSAPTSAMEMSQA